MVMMRAMDGAKFKQAQEVENKATAAAELPVDTLAADTVVCSVLLVY